MTTATNPGNYVDFDEYVGLKLEKTRSTIRSTDLLTALFGVAAMFLTYLLAFVVLDQWIIPNGFNMFWRWILLSTLLLTTIAWLIWKVGVPSLRTVNGLFAAREIEKAEPELKSNLLNLIDLKSAGRKVNPAILKAMERQAAVRLQHVDISQAVDHRPLVRTLYVLLAIIVVCCFYAMLSPKKVMNSIWRGLLPAAQVLPATITEILDVSPGDATVPAHQPMIEVQVDLSGEIPQQVTLFYSTADGQQDQPIELHSEQTGQPRYRGQIVGDSRQGLVEDLTYYIRAGDAKSRQFKIHVEQPPYADIESIGIEFPSYMKLQPVEQKNNGAIDAWEGAKIVLNARTNMPVFSAAIQFLDDPQAGPTGEEVPMTVTSAGRKLQSQWTLSLRSDGSFPKFYRIHCKTENGRVTTGHVINPLTIRPDLPPEVVLLQPDRDLDAPANATIPLLIQVRDPDFELGYVYLNVDKSGQRIVREILSEGRQSRLTLKHDLDLAKLNPVVGDQLEFWIEAYDNKQPRPNTRNSPKVKIRIVPPVSKKEAEQQLAEQKASRDEKLAESNQEANPDQTPTASQKDGDAKERSRANDDKPKEADAKPGENRREDTTQDAGQGQPEPANPGDRGKQNQNGEAKNGSGQPKTSPKDANQKSVDSAKMQDDEKSKPADPLNNDGSQDDEALRRISEKLNQKKPQNSNTANDQSKSNETQPSQSGKDEAPPNDQKQQADGKAQPKRKSGSDAEKSKSQSGDQQKSESRSGASQKNDPDGNPSAKKQETDQLNSKPSDQQPEPASDSETKEKQKPTPDGVNDKQDTNESVPKKQPSRKAGDKDSAERAADAQNPPQKNANENSTGGNKPVPKPDKKSDKKSEKDNNPENSGDKSAAQSKSKSKEPSDKSHPEQTAEGDQKNSSEQPGEDKPKAMPDEKGIEQKPDSKKAQDEGGQQSSKSSDKPEADSNENSSGAGSKGSGDSKKQKSSDNQSSDNTANDPSKPNSSKDSSNSDSDPNGPKEQVPDSPNAKKGTSDGTEQGTAQPNNDPDAKRNSPKSNNVKTDPNKKPVTRPSDTPSEDAVKKPKSANDKSKASKPNDPSQNNQTPDQNGDSQDSKQRDGDGSKAGQKAKSGSEKQQSESGTQEPQDSPSGKQPADSPSSEDSGKKEAKQGQGGKNGQTSQTDQPSNSNSKDEDENKSPATKEKPGDGQKQASPQPNRNSDEPPTSENKPDKSDSSQKQSGGKKPSAEQNSEKGGKQSDSQKSESGGKKDSQGGDGEKEGGGESKPGGKPSNSGGQSSNAEGKNGPPSDSGTSGGTKGTSNGGTGEGGDSAELPPGDEANLEYNRQATELILQKLKKELERGDVDRELLEQLGWTKSEMKQFADRLSKSMEESKRAPNTPEAKARQQQFQEMLKNLDLQKSGTTREGAQEPKRNIDQIESKRTPPPASYRSAYEKFTRDLSRQKTKQKDAPSK